MSRMFLLHWMPMFLNFEKIPFHANRKVCKVCNGQDWSFQFVFVILNWLWVQADKCFSVSERSGPMLTLKLSLWKKSIVVREYIWFMWWLIATVRKSQSCSYMSAVKILSILLTSTVPPDIWCTLYFLYSWLYSFSSPKTIAFRFKVCDEND